MEVVNEVVVEDFNVQQQNFREILANYKDNL